MAASVADDGTAGQARQGTAQDLRPWLTPAQSPRQTGRESGAPAGTSVAMSIGQGRTDMDQRLAELASALRKTIDAATASSALHDENDARTLHRAVALLWSAHDEITTLQSLRRRHA
jgi:hypothetical protein